MDTFEYSLESTYHLRLVPTPPDGNCLFHAISMALKRFPLGAAQQQNTSHVHVRDLVCTFLSDNMKYFAAFNIDDAYITRMNTRGTWGGEPELIAIANVYARSIEIYMFDPHGRATHTRTYSPVLGVEAGAPFRVSLLPASGVLTDAPNHYSYLEQVPTVLGAVHRPIAPASMPIPEIDLTSDEPMPPSSDDCDPRPSFLEPSALLPEPGKKTRVNYYKLYEHYLNTKGMHRLEADLAARAEMAWYTCTCGKACRKAPFADQAFERIVLDPAQVNPDCKVWKPWSMYQTVVRVKLGRVL